MKQTVKYNGYTANTSDYLSKDGDLSASLNLINEDGGMKTIFEPSVVKDFSGFPYTKVVYLHRTASFSHIIMQRSNNYAVQWMNESDTPSAGTIHAISGTGAVTIGMLHNVTSVANTLVILSDTGLHYILWNGYDYKYIGQKPPFLSIRFSVSENKQCLRTKYNYGTDQYVVPARTNNYVPYQATNNLRTDYGYNVFKNSDVRDAVTQATWALVNNTNAQITKDGHFYAPFFVRYCYRLFDGSTFMSSAPLFIPLSMPYTYQVFLSSLCKKTSGSQTMEILSNSQSQILIHGVYVSGDNIFITYLPSNVALTYFCDDEDTLAVLKNDWGDIVKSIDIFVSGPIIRENDSEQITKVRERPFHYNAEYKQNVTGAKFTQYLYDHLLYPGTGTLTDNHQSYYILDIPMKSDEQYLSQIKDNAAFYKVKSFNLSEDVIINNAFDDLSIDGGVLSTLYTQEALADDYKSHNGIMPFMVDSDNSVTSLFTYNSRLHVAAIKEKLFGGFMALDMVPFISSDEYTTATVGDIHLGFTVYKIWVYLKTEDGEKIVLHSYSSGEVLNPFLIETSPLFYPDNRAVKMVIEFKYNFLTGQPTHYVEYRMEPCPTMNGAYTTGKLENTNLHPLPEEYDSHESYTPPPDPSQLTPEQSLVPYANKIYTADVANPYRFPASGIVTVGVGTILGLQSATAALSQGQFGQFPLYIFATDGVWALSVSDTGTYTNVHPVSRDVCVNRHSVTSLDNAVVFATDRGLFMVQGSNVRCITDDIASQYPFDIDNLPSFSDLLTAAGWTNPPCQVYDFKHFMDGCQVIYDYHHQRIIVFNPSTSTGPNSVITYIYNYAYVYSLKTGTWGLTESNLLYRLNSYPEAWAVNQSNQIVNFSANESDTDHRKAILLTRPLKLGDGDTLKSLRTLVQRGVFQRGDVQTALYASRDLYSWQLVASSVDHFIRNLRGTPYKYFRVAAFTELDGSKSLYGAEVDVEPRHTSRIV